MKFSVTQADIDEGVRDTVAFCVVATVIGRTIPQATRISVDAQTIRWTRTDEGKRYVYLTPPVVRDYVIAFDAGDDLKPMTFELSEPIVSDMRSRVRAPRLIFKAERNGQQIPSVRTRCFGERALRVNRQREAS